MQMCSIWKQLKDQESNSGSYDCAYLIYFSFFIIILCTIWFQKNFNYYQFLPYALESNFNRKKHSQNTQNILLGACQLICYHRRWDQVHINIIHSKQTAVKMNDTPDTQDIIKWQSDGQKY